VTLAGQTVIPDQAVTAIARFPGSALEAAGEAIATRMALNPNVSLQAAHRVGRAGEILGKIGPAQALEGVPRGLAALPLGGGKTLGEYAGEAFDRYHLINRIRDPIVREKLLRLATMRESATGAQTARWVDEIESLFKGVPVEEQRVIRDMIESPDSFDWNVERRGPVPTTDALAARRGIGPRAPGGGGIGPATGVPKDPSEVFIGKGSDTTGPATMFGQPAAPTAVPGTPDAARYGAMPGNQVPIVTEGQRELAARVENALRDARVALERRGRIPEGGRPNYFPRERTRESLIQWEGEDARIEKLGRGVDPRKDYRAGFQKARTEASWINELIDRVNAQTLAEAEAKGMSPAGLIPKVEDTTTAINEFWRRLPEPLRAKLTAEPERFVDRPKEQLQRYFSRATKSINDWDTLAKVRSGEAGVVARKFAYEGHNGKVHEWNDLPPKAGYDIPNPGPGVMVDPSPAPRGAPKLEAGRMGRRGEAMVAPEPRPVAGQLPGEVPPGGAEAFQGKSPFDPSVPRSTKEIPGYVYPENKAWRQAYPNVALPKEVATWIDAMGKPYWATEPGAAFFERLFIQPLHKMVLPWKVAATSGAGPRFALRNYMSQQVFNLQEYGPRTFAPRIQQESHLLGLPDSFFAGRPELSGRVYTDATGRTWTAQELREVAKQSGLWRTLPEAEGWTNLGQPFPQIPSAGSSAVFGWEDPKAKLSAALGKAELGAKKAAETIAPVNPVSKGFIPTKEAFHPLAEYGERQGRMAALLLGLDEGMPLWEAATRANKVHVNYQAFSPTFEKYATLAWPFAKFTAGMTPNQVKWALQYPGRTLATEHFFRGGEAMVPEDERARFAAEPKSQLITEAGGRLVGYPGVGVLREPEAGKAKGDARLPYVTMPPTADVFLNKLGAPVRVANARDPWKQLGKETVEGAFPVFKMPYELATGRNVYTGEPVEAGQATIAPRMIQAFYEQYPGLAKSVLGATEVVDRKSGQRYLAVPQRVAMIERYFPNVAAMDLVAGLLGVKRPYDNQTAMALRLLGVTQIMHDPQIPAVQSQFEARDEAARFRKKAESWTPDPSARRP
ncbi:MAG: hypothetical protein ACM3UX_01050, partial [Candidatus Woesearchaeota archaeon]